MVGESILTYRFFRQAARRQRLFNEPLVTPIVANYLVKIRKRSKLPLTQWLATTNLPARHLHHGFIIRAYQTQVMPRLSTLSREVSRWTAPR